MNLHAIRSENDDTLAYYREVWRTWDWQMFANGTIAYRAHDAVPTEAWIELDPDTQEENEDAVAQWVARGRPTGRR